jgi:hypothetical protein
MLKAPAFAQFPAQPPSASALGDHDGSQSLGDTPWWQDNDWWGEDYQAVWYPAASCRYWSQPSWTLRPYQHYWWSEGSDSAWYPAGSPWQFPYHSDWCRANYGNANRWYYVHLWVNKNPIQTKKHHPKWNQKWNNEMCATVEKAHGEPNPDGGGPDDDWTRVEDDHVQQTAALQRQHDQGIHALQRRRPAEQQALNRQHPPQQRKLQGAHAEKIQGVSRRTAKTHRS